MNDYTDKLLEWLGTIGSALPWIGLIAGLLCIMALLVILVLHLLDIRRLLRQKTIFLELTPPAGTAKTPEATQRLFTVLHGLYASRPLPSKLQRQKVVFSLEMPSTRQEGIRYVMRVPRKQVGFFEQAVVSYLPSVRTQRVDDYLPSELDHRKVRVLEFKQTGHLAYPLQAQSSLHVTDLVGYLTGVMTKLQNDELISFQLTVSPAKVRQADRIGRRLLNNEELLERIGKRHVPIRGIFSVINALLFGLTDFVGDIFHGSSKSAYSDQQRQLRYQQDVAAKIKPARVLSAFEQELAESVNDKVRQPLYRVSIRAVIVMKDESTRAERIEGVKSALSVFSIPGYQSLKARYNFPNFIKGRYRLFLFRHRLPALLPGKSSVLSASEIGSMYHFPTSAVNKTENVATSLSKALPAGIALKRNADTGNLDVVLGKNVYHGTETAIGLTAAERQRHVYIIGGTGNGKTTMLEYAIIQDIKNGKGVAVVDPHGDLASRLLNYIPEDRINDVVYLNPKDIKYPIGLNLLELPEGLDEDELLLEKERVTEAVISVLRKVFSDDAAGAHRIESTLRNAIHTAMTVEGATLFTVLKLLRNSKYRKAVIAKLKDEDLKDYWREELGKAGGMQLVSITKGINSRIDRFRSSEPAKRMLSQTKSTINFEDIINSGKILICNLALGEIGEDTSALFGTTVLAKLKMAAERRASIPEHERRPFYLYVDEFQEFATMPFVKMLSSSRKYKLFLTMAEQSTTQQEEMRLSESILNNAGTVVCFKTGSSLDVLHILPRFKPYIEEQEIMNLDAYNFYAKLGGQKAQEPVSGETVLPESEGDAEVAQRVIDSSRDNYAKLFTLLIPGTDKSTKKEADGRTANKNSSVGHIPKKIKKSHV